MRGTSGAANGMAIVMTSAGTWCATLADVSTYFAVHRRYGNISSLGTTLAVRHWLLVSVDRLGLPHASAG